MMASIFFMRSALRAGARRSFFVGLAPVSRGRATRRLTKIPYAVRRLQARARARPVTGAEVCSIRGQNANENGRRRARADMTHARDAGCTTSGQSGARIGAAPRIGAAH